MNPPSVLSAQVALRDHVPQSGLRRICRTTRTAQQGIYCIAERSSHRSQRRLDRKLGISRSKCPEFQEVSGSFNSFTTMKAYSEVISRHLHQLE